MKIQSLNNQYAKSTPNFRSAYPVVHWVAETNGKYAPAANLQLVKKLQSKIVRILNKPLMTSDKPMNSTEQKLRAYIGSCDVDYRNKSLVRSFYNRIEGTPDRFNAVSYMISGADVGIFENYLAKNIGRAKAAAKNLFQKPQSPETEEAVRLYNRDGLNFVKNNARQIKDRSGMPYILHTKFEIIRNRSGEIKDYRFVDARFLPASKCGRSTGKM